MTTAANETAVNTTNPPHSPESTPEATAAKRTAEVALPTTTPSRLRTAKRVNDDNIVRHVTPGSPTRKRAATLDSQANLYTPPASVGQPKPGIQHLRFTKIPGSQMMSRCPTDPLNAGSAPGTPPPGPANSHAGTQPSTQEHPDPQDPADGDHDMNTNRSDTPPLPPSAHVSHARDDNNGMKDHFQVDEDDLDDSPSGPDLTYPLDVPVSYVHGIENGRAEHIATAETKARWSKLRTLGDSVMLWVAAYRGEVDKARTHILLAQKIATILGRDAMPDALTAVVAPRPKAGDIWPFCLAGLLEAESKQLTDRYIWIYEDIQFFVVPYPVDPPTFVAALVREATFFPDEVKDNKWMTNLVRQCLREHHADLLNFCGAYHDKIQVKNKTDAHYYLNKVLDSLQVVRYHLTDSKHKTYYYYNIHVSFPASLNDKFATWKSLFENFNGQGNSNPYYDLDTLGKVEVLRRGHNCTICKGLDHPSSACHYPKIPGWPKPENKSPTRGPPNDPTPYRGGSNRGARGSSRGRGRGRRGRGA
ncbi:hypothetical protein M422DRAFT_52401 [Sphaerobolus stellatus SS14]|uniref:Uncharacterized protein n=1 Tax=Sphaerobolus stellatus (strain SS14) TaxID=990650 RepID=A0A0C9UWD5_SPHS4|nr:hypothetical protein M422DRAFT_52401 [Sphaerobolus stellatus SS14]